jgi:hypothetical protein
MKVFINTTDITAEIKGELFIPGEWKHVPDTFVIDQKLYPYIKEAHVVLEERTKQVLSENGLNQFAQGVKEAAEMYSKVVPTIATDVAKYAPMVAVTAEVEPVAKEAPPEEVKG